MAKTIPFSCLSSCSYIKPQLFFNVVTQSSVVYHLVPTSNHNVMVVPSRKIRLFIILFLHQTTTIFYMAPDWRGLFIILFLHQTTTYLLPSLAMMRCLSSCSYIKPQPSAFSTREGAGCLSSCSYIKPQPKASQKDLEGRCLSSCSYIKPQLPQKGETYGRGCLSSCSYIKPQPIVVNLLVISKILRFGLLRNGRAGRFLLQIY